jgi:hypothetical protein
MSLQENNPVNNNPNRDKRRKEKSMKSTRRRTITQIMALSLLSMTSAIPIFAEEPSTPRILDKTPTLPFSIKITETVEMPDMRGIYYSDFPSGLFVIDGELWLIGKNGDGPGVRRMKGKDIENLKGLPGGKAGTGSGTGNVHIPGGNTMAAETKGKCYRPYETISKAENGVDGDTTTASRPVG